MHRCFQIPEILSLICDELHAMSSQSLVHLALTSRALSQQPLDKLWSRIDDLAILFNGCDGLLTGEEVFHGDYAHMEYVSIPLLSEKTSIDSFTLVLGQTFQ